jgi:ABC-type bacteriocin/lantibiotic exporter with double-glycine peptidase domain
MDCGPTCLRMICSYYGRNISIQKLRALCYTNRSGVNLWALSDAAEKLVRIFHKMTIFKVTELINFELFWYRLIPV